MRKFMTGDCETDPFKYGRVPEPFLWCFFDGDSEYIFYDTLEALAFIKEYDGLIYMHNGGKFDFFYILAGLEPDSDIMIINGRIAKMKIGQCELRDSFLILPVPLSAYEKDEIDYNKFERDIRDNHMREIVKYCLGDCRYLWDILKENFEMFGQKLTLASSAFAFWNKNFNDAETPSTSQHYFSFIKDYYFGGRVQCFQKGIIKEPFEVWDINSAYPYAMTFKHPIGKTYDLRRDIREQYIENSFYHIRAKSNGALPFRDKGKLTFPDDDISREFFVCGYELKMAMETNKIQIEKVLTAREYVRTTDFTPYVNHFYAMKNEQKGKNKAKYLLAKLYLNSLYGKFGQSSLDHKNYSLVNQDEILMAISEGKNFVGELGKLALMDEPIPENHMRFYNVATAASITSFVRAYLFNHILSSDLPLYCDTDSIAARKVNCQEGKGLGQWEKEGNFIEGAIGGKKLYAFKQDNGKYKLSSKGVKLNAKQIFDVAKGKKVLYKNDAPTFSIQKSVTFLEREVTLT